MTDNSPLASTPNPQPLPSLDQPPAAAAPAPSENPPFNGWDVVFSRIRAGFLIAESNRDLEIPSPWRIVRHKRYGGTVVHLAASE